jgi:hypothetical protein
MSETSVEADVDELDRWSREILVGLKRDGGEALVAGLVDATTVEERQNIHYRVDEILEPAGLVEKHLSESDSSTLPKSRLELTDNGQNAALLVEEQWGAEDIDEAITSLKQGVEKLESRIALLEAEGRPDGIENEFEELEDRVSELEEGFRLTNLAAEDRKVVAEMRAGLSVIERVLVEELDAGEYMKQYVDDERERIYTEMDLTDQLSAQ